MSKSLIAIAALAAVTNVSPEEANRLFPQRPSAETPVRVLANREAGTIPDAVYGQFIEHLGYCVNGPIGMWSEVVLNRKFFGDFTNPASQMPGGWARRWTHGKGMVRTQRVPAHTGQWCLELLPGEDSIRGRNEIRLGKSPGGTNFTVEGWCLRREPGNDASPQITLEAVDGAGKRTSLLLTDLLGRAAVPGVWHAFRQVVELPTGTASLELQVGLRNGPTRKGGVFLDDLKITGGGLANGGFELADTSKASHWTPRGSVVMAGGRQAFVGDQSPRLADGASLHQAGIALRGRMDYRGQIVLRGSPGSSCEVTLRGADGSSRLVCVTGLKEAWGTYPLTFHIDAPVNEARLEIAARGGAVTIGAVSLMPADNVAGFRRDIVEKMKELQAPNYRWPGGCYVGAWRWKEQLGERDTRVPRNAEEPNDVGIHEFIALCRELSTEPVLCVNTGRFGEHGTPEYNRDLVLYCNSVGTPMAELRTRNGHPEPFSVRLFAIGNEMYGNWQHGHYDSVEEYAAKHNQTVAAMRTADPTIKVIAVGFSAKPERSTTIGTNAANWSQAMLEQCAPSMDYISEHFYSDSISLRGKDLFGHMTDLRDNLLARFGNYRRIFAATGIWKPVMLDEWNYWYGPEVYGAVGPAYFLKDGIGVAAGLHAIYRNLDLIAGCNFAQTVNVLGAICANRTDSAFSAVGLPLVLYRQHFGKYLIKVENPDPTLEAVAAWTVDRKALTIALINFAPGPKKVPLILEGCDSAAQEVEWHFIQQSHHNPDAQNVPGQEAAIRIQKAILPVRDIRLSPYSINVLVLPATPSPAPAG